MSRRPKSPPDPIGLRIKEIRVFLALPRKQAWNQAELGAALGLDERTIRRRERNGDLTLKEAVKLAGLAGCDLTWLAMAAGGGPGSRARTTPIPAGGAHAVSASIARAAQEEKAAKEASSRRRSRRA